MKYFIFPFIVSGVALIGAYMLGGVHAALLVFLLSVLEVALSFDNAVVNARTLSDMSAKWQSRFLTWGMLIAVFGARFVLPVLVVAVAAAISPFTALHLALYEAVEYGHLLEAAHPLISAFGGAYLLMVALNYFFDEAKRTHWINFVEKRLTHWGRIEAIEIAITLGALLVCAWGSSAPSGVILAAGCVGIVLFIFVEGLSDVLGTSAAGVARSGLALFIYLNILDTMFSLDGVIGAFAITTNLAVIVVGLSIGAYFVRALTLLFVRRGVLTTLIYLEHGAYWGIFALALCMFYALVEPLPDVIPAFIGIVLIGSAYFSSLRARAPREPLAR